jgi:hypothetical protein
MLHSVVIGAILVKESQEASRAYDSARSGMMAALKKGRKGSQVPTDDLDSGSIRADHV